MKQKKFVEQHAKTLSFVLIGLALFFFILAAWLKNGVGFGFCIVLFLLCFVGSVALFAYAGKGVQSRVCYFYYDRDRHCRIPQDALTFEIANASIEHYLFEYVQEPLDLLDDVPKDLRIQLQAEPAFAPLIAFKMLYELALLEPSALLQRFTAADERAIGFACRALAKCNEAEMADLISKMKRNVQSERNRIVAFFTKNRRWFEGRILHYIKQNAHGLTVFKNRLERKGETE